MLEEGWRGLGEVRTRLTWGSEKRACSLFIGWMRVRGGGVPGEGRWLGVGGRCVRM